jgi:cytochrome P450
MTADRLDAWADAPDGSLDISREMDQLTLLNIGRVLFGFDPCEAFLDAFAIILEYLGKISNAATLGFPVHLRPSDNQAFSAALATLETTVRDVMKSRPDTGAAMLHLFRDGSQPLTSTEMRNEIISMLTAGHETTAVTLTWMWDMLLRDPAMSERFYEEVDAVVGKRPVTVEDLPRLPFTNQLFLETMRLYPPIWIIGRLARRDQVVGGYHIAAGSTVALSPFLTHRHPDYWDDPEVFRPERWVKPTTDHPFAYFPFLVGRHVCLGKHLATAEILVVMATIAQRYRLEPVREHPSAYNAKFSLRIRDGLPVRIRRRA